MTRLVLALVFAAGLGGCVSVRDTAEANRDYQMLRAALDIYATAEAIPVSAPSLPRVEASLPPARRVAGARAAIMRDALDVGARAEAALSGDAPPHSKGEEPVGRLSSEDDRLYHVDVGLQAKSGARRRFWRELPARLLDLVAEGLKGVVVRVVPAWVFWALGLGGAAYLALLVYGRWLVVDRRRARRAYDGLDDAVEGAFDGATRGRLRLGGDSLREHRRRNDERKARGG